MASNTDRRRLLSSTIVNVVEEIVFIDGEVAWIRVARNQRLAVCVVTLAHRTQMLLVPVLAYYFSTGNSFSFALKRTSDVLVTVLRISVLVSFF